jgi:hypothetical protein
MLYIIVSILQILGDIRYSILAHHHGKETTKSILFNLNFIYITWIKIIYFNEI